MNIYKSLFLSAALTVGACLYAKDCGPALSSVKVSDVEMYTLQGNMTVNFNLVFDAVNIGRNQQVIYTPVLKGAGNDDICALPAIVLNGRNVEIREQRQPSLQVMNAGEVMRRYNNTMQSTFYTASVPYEAWMDLCELTLNEDLCGCGDLLSQDKRDLMAFDNRPAPETVLMFIEPEVEAVKAREEKGCAYVDFVVNTIDIRPAYRNNTFELNKIISSIDLVKNDPNVTINEINIHGYASPEGTWDRNVWLAENRAVSLTDYVKGLYTIPADVFTTSSTPEDWEGLRRFLMESDIAYKEDLLAIVDDSSLEPDTKDWRLKLRYPEQYAYMLANWYPALRHSDYVIHYTVRPFSVEEAAAMLRINPAQVSLNEMFMVAQSYTPGTPEYNEVMDIAVLTYPDDPVANYNAALTSINKGDLLAAESYLSKAGESAGVYNARGVMAFNQGNLDDAEDFFIKAAQGGNKEASENLLIVDRQRVLNKQNR